MEQEEKSIEMFTAPKVVKKNNMRDVILFELIAVFAVAAILLLMKAFLPEIYENVNSFIKDKLTCWS